MTHTSPALRTLALASLVLAAACADQADQPAAPTPPAQQTAQTEIDPLQLSREIPGFGGLYLDGQGRPTVYLTDLSETETAERVLNPYAKTQRAPQLVVRQGRYEYTDLNDWHGKVNAALSLPGVVLTDLDEANNIVRVGVERGSKVASNVRALATRLGVPEEAVQIEEVDPIIPAVTLRETNRPIRAGLQINFGNYVCTLGFNASHSGGNSFITNSHCTNVQGGTEGTRYYQPSTAQPQIATEAADPGYTSGGSCPSGRVCRRSDSSRALYASGVSFERGRIARTSSRGTLSGSITISTTSPYFTITGEGSVVAGTQVNKIGRTTGWTYGNVTSTCTNINVSGTNITQLCQNVVSGGVGGGDSGSPVFTWSGSGGNVTLVGILWGGNSSGNQFIFSPLSAVESELGALTTS
ncbi:MAG TPA: hypothetical protein VFQ39_06660 [Longimicrobium sp.]|nr:hypothetical protein [Longimicrobium sp.]